MKSSFKYIEGGISFEMCCKIIDNLGGCASQRDGMHDVYMSYKKIRNYVTHGDTAKIAHTILAQDLSCQW